MSDKDIDKKIEEEEELTDEEMDEMMEKRNEAVQAVMERKVFLSEKYVEPHRIPSRRVKDEDLDRVLVDAKIMHEMCMVGRGDFSTAFAIAHTQICDKDPLRFFVNADGQIYINPVITDKGNEIATVQEGCMSYPEEPFKTLIRYKTVTAKFRTVGHKVDGESGEDLGQYYISKEVRKELEGEECQVMQHECQHLNGSDIYQPDTTPSKAFWEPEVDKKD